MILLVYPEDEQQYNGTFHPFIVSFIGGKEKGRKYFRQEVFS